ncbi:MULTISPECIES: alpha/beta hydrolase [unclassified Sphingobium]|uniref:alpha/beta hydrolase n=1 Tax=unclassified Sphingobium TaxID=2611147 RepID=UPI0015E7327F|nr:MULTISPECIES: alpha/beta hydrolase [unclassified Sphingobium]
MGVTAVAFAFSTTFCQASQAQTPTLPASATPTEGPRQQPGPELKISLDLVYSRDGDKALGLDLYRIEPAPAKPPVVIWIHGEGAPGGKIASPAVGMMRPGGIAVASIDYRSGPGVTLAMQLDDVKAAVRWLRANAADYDLDPAQIAVMGFGVGGQLAALAGTTGDRASLNREFDSAVSSRVQAVVDLAGPVASGGLDAIRYVTADDAPFLIVHGTADRDVSTRQSQMLISALKVANVDSTLTLPMAASHDLADLLSPIVVQSISRFFDQYLLQQPAPASLSAFVTTPRDNFVDPVALSLGGTEYQLYPTPARGEGSFGSYRIYLPPGYSAEPRRRYPVIYFLHGMNVDSKRAITSEYISRADAAIRSGVMPPAIIVLAESPNTGWYLDREDGGRPVETVLIENLIPYVDGHYRTIASAKGRAIEGHSMGGYGALRLGFKYADMFAAVTGNAPAIFDKPAKGISQTYWDAQSIAHFAMTNFAALKHKKLRIIVGDRDSLFSAATKTHEFLNGLGLPHAFITVPGAPHNFDQILQYEPFDTMAFYGRVFSGTKAKTQ